MRSNTDIKVETTEIIKSVELISEESLVRNDTVFIETSIPVVTF